MATHFSILIWRIPMDRGAWRATVHGVTESDVTEQLTTAQWWFQFQIVDSQGVNFCCKANWLSYTHIQILFYIIFHYDLSQDIEYSSLCNTVGPCWLSILYIIVCICWPQTPIHLFSTAAWQPQVCSLPLWACFYFIDRFICAIF